MANGKGPQYHRSERMEEGYEGREYGQVESEVPGGEEPLVFW